MSSGGNRFRKSSGRNTGRRRQAIGREAEKEKKFFELLDSRNISKKTTIDKSMLRRQAAASLLESDPGLLNLRKIWMAGNLAGLIDAVLLSDDAGKSLPPWTAPVLASSLRASLLRARLKQPARPRSQHRWFTQYLRDMRDYHRYEAVVECRANREAIEKSRKNFPYYHAEILLFKTPFAGSEKAIQHSYERVLKNFKRNPHRYYVSRYMQLFLGPEVSVLARIQTLSPPKKHPNPKSA